MGSTEKNDHSIGQLSHAHQKSCGEPRLSCDFWWARFNFPQGEGDRSFVSWWFL